MIREFRDDERAYLGWVADHPAGFVANLEKRGQRPEYPMVHHLAQQCVSSPSRGNYTTAKYFKVCSERLDELEHWSKSSFGRALVRCSKCMK